MSSRRLPKMRSSRREGGMRRDAIWRSGSPVTVAVEGEGEVGSVDCDGNKSIADSSGG